MYLVYTNESNVLVNHARNLLNNAGINIVVKNEYASTGGHANFVHLELWVHEQSEHEMAQKALASLLDNGPSLEWLCGQCNEQNDSSFEICWQCGSEHAA